VPTKPHLPASSSTGTTGSKVRPDDAVSATLEKSTLSESTDKRPQLSIGLYQKSRLCFVLTIIEALQPLLNHRMRIRSTDVWGAVCKGGDYPIYPPIFIGSRYH
jgi:hypothetical protein